MTLRKPVQAGGAHGSQSLPYPGTPVSPVKAAPQILEDGQFNGAQTSHQSAEGSFPWPGEPLAEKGSAGQLPPLLTSGIPIMDSNTATHSNDLPTSLHISHPDVTPGSSFGSRRSTSPCASEFARSNVNGSSNISAPVKSNSNNPFLRHLGGSTALPADQVTESSSAQIWADEKNTSNAIPSAERLPDHTSLSRSLDLDSSYSPICPTPFDEPCMNAATPSATQQHSHSYKGVPEGTVPWLDESRDLSGHGSNRSLMESSVPEVQPNELRELETPWGGEMSLPINRSEASTDTDPRQDYAPPLPARAGNNGVLPLPPSTQHDSDALPGPVQPHVDTSAADSGAPPIASRTHEDEARSKKQRGETYQIRLVNWYDASSSTNPRRSPIMVQNANGPCPLLALVNALVLSTPAALKTVLMDTLERREQITLGLLLDAVIDELMSGRRGDAAQNLPDVSDLYGFLVNLHAGMNVNPRFVSRAATPLNLMDAPIPETTSNGSLSGIRFAGGFEDTREMKLYSTFAVPLIHGWIPPRNHPAFAALQRSAQSYEDAQNLMFAEEDLENKLQRQGLDEQEQLVLEDIASIKYFLSSSATQLTGYGLDSMTESLTPSQIAILFRNDHFSTLYRHPRSGQLFTLVTDMGYAGHDEVVWESLVDVSGEGCEFFAGDFRPVGNNHAQPSHTPSGRDECWTTVGRSSNGRRSRRSPHGDDASQSQFSNAIPDVSALTVQDYDQSPKLPNFEQEDHDLALALQLQEEEEDRERQEMAARKRENELSQAFLESQPAPKGRSAKTEPVNRTSAPPRGNRSRAVRSRDGRTSQAAGVNSANSTPRPSRSDESEDAPPPSYEQAASGPAYNPPANHPAYPHASNGSLGNTSRPPGRQRHSSAYTQTSAAMLGSPPASSPSGPPCGQSPSLTSGSRRRSSFRTSMPTRGGLGGVEGAPGVYRQTPGLTPDEPGKKGDKGDCTIM